MHNITFVNKANFIKVYNNFVLKWLIFPLYVVVVTEQILLGSIWMTLQEFVTSVQWFYRSGLEFTSNIFSIFAVLASLFGLECLLQIYLQLTGKKFTCNKDFKMGVDERRMQTTDHFINT
jgi:hypothetical protein